MKVMNNIKGIANISYAFYIFNIIYIATTININNILHIIGLKSRLNCFLKPNDLFLKGKI